MATCHFIKLNLGNKSFKDKVSIDGCNDVVDFRDSIKNTFPTLLASCSAIQFILFQPDEVTEIDPATYITDLERFDDPSKPMTGVTDIALAYALKVLMDLD